MNTYFLVYLLGYGLMIVAVWFGLDAAGVAQTWKLVAVLFLLGLGIIYAFSQAQTDSARRDQARGGQGASSPNGGGAQGGSGAQGGGAQTGGSGAQQQQQGGGHPQGGAQQGSTPQSNPPS